MKEYNKQIFTGEYSIARKKWFEYMNIHNKQICTEENFKSMEKRRNEEKEHHLQRNSIEDSELTEKIKK